SVLAWARWPITCFIACAYGREVRIRSCALRILEAETISSARVTLRVFCTLLILVLISRPPAISSSRLAGPGARRLDLVPSTRRASPPRFGLPGTGRLELFDALLERSLDLVVPGAGAVDLLDQLAGGVGEVGVQAFLEGADLGDRHVVQVTLVDGVDRQRLVGDRHRQVLLLLHQLGDALAALELLAGRFVQVRGELGERRQLAVLRQRDTDAAGQLLDDLGLGGATDARHRDTGVHGRADAGVEQ